MSNRFSLSIRGLLAAASLTVAACKRSAPVRRAVRKISDALNPFYKAVQSPQAQLALQSTLSEYPVLATKCYRNGALAYLDILDAQRPSRYQNNKRYYQ